MYHQRRLAHRTLWHVRRGMPRGAGTRPQCDRSRHVQPRAEPATRYDRAVRPALPQLLPPLRATCAAGVFTQRIMTHSIDRAREVRLRGISAERRPGNIKGADCEQRGPSGDRTHRRMRVVSWAHQQAVCTQIDNRQINIQCRWAVGAVRRGLPAE